MKRPTEPMSLDEILEYLVACSKRLRAQMGAEEYEEYKRTSFARATATMRTAVGYLPGGLFYGRKAN